MAKKKKKKEDSYLGGLLDKLREEFPHPVKKAMDEAEGSGSEEEKERARKLREGFRKRNTGGKRG